MAEAGEHIIDVAGYQVNKGKILGKGGFGIVYIALNPEGEEVAIKCISCKRHPKLAIREALNHKNLPQENSNIIGIRDVKIHDGSFWIAMDYCKYGDLNSYFKNRVISVESKVKIMLQIAEGLFYLHGNDIVHRDIKPQNILVEDIKDDIPMIKLTDFGLAKFLDSDSNSSAMSTDLGTHAFKAPEFWDPKDGEGKLHYHRSVDIFACGMTFLAMLQAKDGNDDLLPSIEESATVSETKKPIGLVMHFRKEYSQPAVCIIKKQEEGSLDRMMESRAHITRIDITKGLKELVQKMTLAEPTKRLTAAEVVHILSKFNTKIQAVPGMDQLEAAASQINISRIELVSAAEWELDFNADSMCVVDGCIATNGVSWDEQGGERLELWDVRGKQLKTWTSACPNLMHAGGFHPLTSIPGTHYLVDGCNFCGLLYVYDTHTGDCISRYKCKALGMCEGPACSILVCEKGEVCILIQLGWDEDRKQFSQIYSVSVDAKWDSWAVCGLCYNETANTVILSDFSNDILHVLELQTGRNIWRLQDEVRGQKVKPRGNCIHAASKSLLVTDLDNKRLLVLNLDTGAVKQVIPDQGWQEWVWNVCSLHDQGIPYVVVKHGDENINSYKIENESI